MLRELQIENFIIVKDQTVTFGPGLNAISGESGSGKSVILQALEFVLGRRSGAPIILPGADAAEVRALFDLSDLPASVADELPDAVRDGESSELLLTRALNTAGRNKIYVNGKLGSVALLEGIGAALVTISSQREHMRLLEAGYHVELLDAFAGSASILERYQAHYKQWSELRAFVLTLEEKLNKSIFRRAELETMVEDLTAAKIKPGMRAELEQEVKRLGAGEMLLSEGQAALDLLQGNESAHEALRAACSKLSDLSRHDPALGELASRAATLRTELEEVGSDLRRYISDVDLNESRLAAARESLADVARLERKYRAPDTALCTLLTEAKFELAAIENPDVLEEKRAELAAVEKDLLRIAEELSQHRLGSAKRLCRAVERELSELGMQDSRLVAQHEKIPFAPSGIDAIELQIAVNKGGDPRPLKQVASGGELSRLFLSAKKVLKERSAAPVLVFDEVDAGVSGKTARAVGEKLSELADASQVICITHLPQVASLADHHFMVEKQRGKLVTTIIRELAEGEKIDEIARMLAGYEITTAARQSARELLSSNSKGSNNPKGSTRRN